MAFIRRKGPGSIDPQARGLTPATRAAPAAFVISAGGILLFARQTQALPLRTPPWLRVGQKGWWVLAPRELLCASGIHCMDALAREIPEWRHRAAEIRSFVSSSWFWASVNSSRTGPRWACWRSFLGCCCAFARIGRKREKMPTAGISRFLITGGARGRRPDRPPSYLRRPRHAVARIKLGADMTAAPAMDILARLTR